MAVEEILCKQKWEKAHKILNTTLSKEIRLMREVLANLCEEEITLLEKNFMKWAKIMRRQSDLVLDLGKTRLLRMESTVELTKCCIYLHKTQMLPPDEEISCEILSKLDQIIALLEKINLQNCRNGVLFEHRKQQSTHPWQCSYPHPLHKHRKKTYVQTVVYTQLQE